MSFCDTVEDAVKDQDTTLMCTIAHACLHLELGFFYGNPCENFETLLMRYLCIGEATVVIVMVVNKHLFSIISSL